MKKEIIKQIQILVGKIKDEQGIINEIIRDDVFSILQACNCTVLYYPLPNEAEDGCAGCHLEKPVNGRMEQFVFINTTNTRERQAFSAAHELGHIWNVDKQIRDLFPDIDIDSEKVINRFAAELLMPEVLFRKETRMYLKKVGYTDQGMEESEVVKMMAYLMNYFFVPFKSVLLRFNELNILGESHNEILLKYKTREYLGEIFKAEQYTRLGIINNLKSLDNLQEYLLEAEEEEAINQNKINRIRATFEISSPNKNGEEMLKLRSS